MQSGLLRGALRRLVAFAGFALLLLGAGPRPGRAVGARFVYVHDLTTPNRVWGAGLLSDGTLDPIAGTPFDTLNTSATVGSHNQTIAYSSITGHLFTVGGGGISSLKVGASGVLTPVLGSPFGGAQTIAVAVAERRGATFVYGSDPVSLKIVGFRAQADGTLAGLASPPIALPNPVTALAAVKDRLFAVEALDWIRAYQVQPDGSLVEVPGSPFNPPTIALGSPVTDRRGRFLHSYDRFATPGAVSFQINRRTGQLRPATGTFQPLSLANTIAGLAGGQSPLLFALGEVVGGTGDIQALRRNRAGNLAPVGSLQDSTLRLAGGVMDRSGRVLVLAGRFGGVRSYRINRRTSQLTLADSETVSLGNATSLAIVPQ